MIPVPSGVRVWLAVGYTDMRRGMNSLALQVQEVLKRDRHAGDLYVFRGRRGHLIKILWHDGIGMSLYAQRLERELAEDRYLEISGRDLLTSKARLSPADRVGPLGDRRLRDAPGRPHRDRDQQRRRHGRGGAAAQRTASTTLANSAKNPSPVFFTIRLLCSAILGLIS
jgi:IS66 Orf2 like protein